MAVVIAIPYHGSRPTEARSSRRNVSIPTDVDKEIRNRPEVNWSAVATQAFRAVLAQLEAEEHKKKGAK